jgi:hypothetical protein
VRFLRKRIGRKIRRAIILVIIATAAKNAYATPGTLIAMAGAMPHFSIGTYYDDNFGLEAGFALYGNRAIDIGIDIRTDFKDNLSAVLMGIGRLGKLSVGVGGGVRTVDGDSDIDLLIKGSLRVSIFDISVRGDLFFDEWGAKPEKKISAGLKLNII